MTDYDKYLVGYTNRLSVVAGNDQQFMVSSSKPGEVKAELVRLICGDPRAVGAGFQEERIDSDLNGVYQAIYQPLVNGSYGAVDNVPVPDAGQLSLYFYPTLLTKSDDQVLVSLGSLCLFIREARFWLDVDGEEVVLDMPLRLKRWHALALEYSLSQVTLDLEIKALGVAEKSIRASQSFELNGVIKGGPSKLVLAAKLKDEVQEDCYNGKLEHLKLSSTSGEIVGEWKFQHSANSSSYNDNFIDCGPNQLQGQFYNCPVRMTKGHCWNASIHDYRHNADHYGAVHFHDDDLTDARWQPLMSWTVPDDLFSGQYALKLTQGPDVDYIPFFVRPSPRHNKASVAYLVPTATYLAYANQRMLVSEGAFASRIQNENDAYLKDHIEVGLSLYEHHTDGSGVHYSSYLRPVLNLKPRGTMWAFNADTNITAWLNHTDTSFDVITDEDLHREGADILSSYSVVLTGTHPEYYSVDMLDGVESYLGQGGRVMYMGGNGFYWKIAYHPDNPAIIEVRRAEDGTRAWMAEPGDYHHSFDGELGGLWRRNGRPPNQVVGIGFAAQGFDGATHYRLTESAGDPRVSFILEGTSGEDIMGNYGSVEGGAAGQEIDRWDTELGSPEHALVIASSENHKPGMLRVVEELNMTVPYLQGSKVRADMTFFETPAGGAVFSTGSISYSGSLAHNNYRNDICQITTNVLRRFADKTPFDYPIAEDSSTTGPE